MANVFPSDWMIPRWPAPAQVRAVCTTRAGGISQAPFASFNLGDHVQDDPAAVQANRQALAQHTGAQPVFLTQVHGARTVELHAASARAPVQTEADACFTAVPGVACTVMVADCLPVLVTHRHLPIVGAAHAGWRGLAGGVLQSLMVAMRAHAQQVAAGGWAQHATVADEWLAWLGPCIGPTAFEVGEEVRAAFVQHDARATHGFGPSGQSGKWLANLPLLAHQRLDALGVQAIYGNDSSAAWCTWQQEQRFYSYRRQACTGRMAAVIWLA